MVHQDPDCQDVVVPNTTGAYALTFIRNGEDPNVMAFSEYVTPIVAWRVSYDALDADEPGTAMPCFLESQHGGTWCIVHPCGTNITYTFPYIAAFYDRDEAIKYGIELARGNEEAEQEARRRKAEKAKAIQDTATPRQPG